MENLCSKKFDMDELREGIRDSAEEVYKRLGPGHSEVTYRKALEIEIRTRGFDYRYEVPMPVMYRNKLLSCGFADIVAFTKNGEGACIIELKAVIHEQTVQWGLQLERYLRSCKDQGHTKLTGIIINFPQKPRGKIGWIVDVVNEENQ